MLRALRRLNPLSPILVKELQAMSRRRRTYLLRVGYLGLLLLFLFGTWASNRDRFGLDAGVAAQMRRQSDLAQQFFALYAIFSTVAMTLIGPVLTCSSISAERLARTLDVLLMTPLNAMQIVTGKLLSRLLVAFTLLGLSIPLLAVVRLLGGIEVESLFGAVALSAGAVTSGAALGLVLSCLSRRTYAVILLSYGILLIVLALLPGLMMLWTANSESFRNGPALWSVWWAAMNPVFSAGTLISPIPVPLPHWSAVALVHAAVAALLLAGSALLVRRLARRQRSDAPTTSSSLDMTVSRQRRDVGDNPVLWREMRRPLLARSWQRVVAVFITVSVLLFSYYSFSRTGFDALKDEEPHIVYSFFFTGLFWLLSTVLAATAVAHERESDTWTLLVASPLSADQIVLGKLAGVLWRVRYPMLIPIAHLLFIGPAAGGMSLLAGIASIAVMICFNLPWIALGLVLSVLCRKVTTAAVLALLIPLGVLIGTPVVLSVAEELTEMRKLSEQSLWLVPYYWQGVAIDRLGRFHEVRLDFWQGGVSESEFLRVLAQACLGHLIVAMVIVWRLAEHFDWIVGRSTQSEPIPPVATASPIA